MQPVGAVGWFLFKRWLLFQDSISVKRFFRIIGIVLLALGITSLVVMINVSQSKVIYSTSNVCKTKSTNVRCQQQLAIQKNMKAPIYVFYYIENIYINHRRYLNSFSPQQLKGQIIEPKKANDQCKPIVYNKDLQVKTSWGGFPLAPQQIASPCGLKAMFFFNDTYRLYNNQGNEILINRKGISLDLNNKHHYKRSVESQKKQWIDPQNEDFINWMQDSSLMTKKKLWGKIQSDLPAGKYKILTQNNYKLGKMKVGKGFQLSTSSKIGGYLWVVPISLIAFGVAAWIFTFFLAYKFDQYEELLSNYRQKKDNDDKN